VLFHVVVYGDEVIAEPMFVPSTLNCTLAIETMLSEAVAVRVTDDPATVAPLDGAVIDTFGAVVSLTVTVNELRAALPALSVAVQVTVVTPSAKVLPDAGLQETESVPSTLSVAVGVAYVTAAPEADVAETLMFDGVPLMTGGVMSPPPPP
jgi:hypothetical protein